MSEAPAAIGGLPDDFDWIVEGDQQGALMGYAVASAGDVNCDGYDDVIVGAAAFDGGQVDEGRVFVFYGSPSGLGASPAWTQQMGGEGAHFGWSVAGAGDVNGDGCDDVIVGAPHHDHGQVDEGGAWIFHGSPAGLSSVAANYDEGNQAGANFGSCVAGAGDVNGDGYDDVIVGAPYYSSGSSSEGRVWVWHGSPTGVSELSDFRAESNQEGAAFGSSVSSAGDVNGDGFSDIIVGSKFYDRGQTDEGVAFVWHGSIHGLNLGVDGSPTNADWIGEINQAGALLGLSVAAAGDVNGDGFGDVIVGGPRYDNGQDSEGGAWVWHGSSSGLSSAWANQDEGNQQDCWFGNSVASAGDVNGDGYDDIVVGAPNYTSGQADEGRVWVWHGSASGVSTTSDWNYQSDLAGAYLGFSVSTAGDVNGDGYDDLLVGAFGAALPTTLEGAAFAFYGVDPDVLFVDGFESGDTSAWSATVP